MYSGNWVRKTNVPYEMKTNKQIKELQYGENHLHLLSFFFSSNNCKRRESLAAGLQKCTTPPYGHTPRTDAVLCMAVYVRYAQSATHLYRSLFTLVGVCSSTYDVG
jgi:hypothetical protein